MKILFFRLQVSLTSAALLPFLFLVAFTTGCSRCAVDKAPDCNAEYSAIVESIGRDPEFVKYTNVRITDEVVIFGRMLPLIKRRAPVITEASVSLLHHILISIHAGLLYLSSGFITTKMRRLSAFTLYPPGRTLTP